MKILCAVSRAKRIFVWSLSAVIILLVALTSLRAAVLRNVSVSVTQPNGEKLAIYASGDEFYNWLHDKAGYTIIQDHDSGYYVYAQGDNGRLVSSGVAVTASEALNATSVTALALPKGLQVAPELRPKPSEMFPGGSPPNQKEILQAPHSGTLNNIVIFIRFSGEAEFTDAISIYDNMFNPTTALYNSMRNYFAQASYNALTISTTFYPTPAATVVSYQDSHNRNYYQPYDATTNPTGYTGGNSGSDRTAREHTLLKSAVDYVSSQVPAGLNVDGDSDGYVDNVCFVIDGDPTGWSSLLWPHMWSLYTVSAYINSKRVYTYNFQLQNSMKSNGVGVLCHEMFHSLGSPDLYHYSMDGRHPAYTWDLMEYNLNPPEHMTSYMKYKYGHWIASIPEITAAGTYTLNPLTSATNNCYKIASPFSTTEYFVLEYRKRTTIFEDSLLGEGLLVIRIDPAYNGNANGPPDELYIYRPNGTTTADGTPGSANFNSTVGRTAINDTTNPSSFLTAGGPGGLSISGIGAVGNTISFTVDFPYVGTKTLNVKATNTGTPVTVSPNDVLGQGNGNTDFSRSYLSGQAVALTAPATSGSLSFRRWYLDGLERATTRTTTVNMDADHTALAAYGLDLGEAVDNTALSWGTVGKGWFGQTTTYYSGNDSAQSAPITHNEKTSMTTTVIGPGIVSWYWKISSEYGYDFSYFYIDGTPYHMSSGTQDWTLVGQEVPAGVHTLSWSYEKDGSTSSGLDAAWVDLVTYSGSGTGSDFNQDGQADILWRYYGIGGYNLVWYLGDSGSGLARVAGSFTNKPQGEDKAIDMLQGRVPGRIFADPREPGKMLGEEAPQQVFWDPRQAGAPLEKGGRESREVRGERSVPVMRSPAEIKGAGEKESPAMGVAALKWMGNGWLPAVTDTNWEIGGTGDFNGDGKVDILWRNYGAGGDNVVWYMDGVNWAGNGWLPAVTDANWKIAGTGDFNGDRKVDILWRNYGVGGDNAVWYMDGVKLVASEFLPAVTDLNWKIGGTGDFNTDGKVDILWRNYGAGGDNVVWYLDGLTWTGNGWLPAVADINWRIENH